MEYLDFDITIKPTDGSDYEVSVRSPGGQRHFQMHFPFDDQSLRAQLEALEVALLRSRARSRRVVSREEQTVEGFGRALFGALIGEVSDLYKLSQQRAGEDKGLRVVLHINDPRLAAVPWEFLYDPEQREYVCLSRHTPIVRYPDQASPVNPISVRPPLRILGMAVSPKGLPKLDLEREKKRMDDAVRPLAGLVELKWLRGETAQDLQNAISSGPWHVFHFIGHGEYSEETDEGCVILADEEGRPERLNALNLARVLQHKPLKMVVLNACEGAKGGGKDTLSSTASPLLLKGVQAVLAMQYEISDDAAVEFSRAFYGAICRGVPIEEALAEARISIAIGNSVEWGTPVLHLRAESGRLFDINLGGERLAAMLTQARAHIAEGDWASAIANLQVVVAADPANAAAAAELERASARQQLDLLYEEGKSRFEAGRVKAFRNWFVAARRRVQVATVAAFALALVAAVYGGIQLKRYIWPPLYTRQFSDPFTATADNRPDPSVWDYPRGLWTLEPGRDGARNRALQVTKTGSGFVKGKVFGDFNAEFWVQYKSGTRAAWLLRAWPDGSGGYYGYYFELVKTDDRFILKSEARRRFFGSVPLDSGQVVGIKEYGARPDDNILVKVKAEGNKFSYEFSLQSTDPDDERPDTTGFFPIPVEDENGYYSEGLFGLAGTDDESQVLYESVAVIPAAPR